MPRLCSIQERIHVDLYDAVAPRAFTPDVKQHNSGHRIKLFGNANIGNPMLTNLQRSAWAGPIPDATLGIYDWYARTNISELVGTDSFKSAWHAWTNAVTVEFIVGEKTYGTRSLAEMLMTRDPINQDIDGAARDSIAKKAWLAFHRPSSQQAKGTPAPSYPHGLIHRHRFPDDDAAELEAQWRCQWPDVKHAWFKAATANLPPRIPVHIHLNQNFGVIATSEPSALRALLEVMPTNIAPSALIWVHLGGWMVRSLQ